MKKPGKGTLAKIKEQMEALRLEQKKREEEELARIRAAEEAERKHEEEVRVNFLSSKECYGPGTCSTRLHESNILCYGLITTCINKHINIWYLILRFLFLIEIRCRQNDPCLGTPTAAAGRGAQGEEEGEGEGAKGAAEGGGQTHHQG